MTETEEDKKSGGLSTGATVAIVLFFIALVVLYVLYNTSKGSHHSNNYFVADLFSTMIMTLITAPFELFGAMAGG